MAGWRLRWLYLAKGVHVFLRRPETDDDKENLNINNKFDSHGLHIYPSRGCALEIVYEWL